MSHITPSQAAIDVWRRLIELAIVEGRYIPPPGVTVDDIVESTEWTDLPYGVTTRMYRDYSESNAGPISPEEIDRRFAETQAYMASLTELVIDKAVDLPDELAWEPGQLIQLPSQPYGPGDVVIVAKMVTLPDGSGIGTDMGGTQITKMQDAAAALGCKRIHQERDWNNGLAIVRGWFNPNGEQP